MALADIRHWQLGDVRVSRIVEVGQFADNIQMLFPDADADWLRRFWVERSGRSWKFIANEA